MRVLVVGLSPRRVPCGVGEIFPLTRYKGRARTMEAGALSYSLSMSKYPLGLFGMTTYLSH